MLYQTSNNCITKIEMDRRGVDDDAMSVSNP